MKTTQVSTVKEIENSDASQLETSAIGKSLSEGKNNSHEDKDSKVSESGNDPLNKFLDVYEHKKVNASGTGYEDDSDDDYDDWFQDA